MNIFTDKKRRQLLVWYQQHNFKLSVIAKYYGITINQLKTELGIK